MLTLVGGFLAVEKTPIEAYSVTSINGNAVKIYKLWYNPYNKIFVIKGTTAISANQLYNFVNPLTYTQAQSLAYAWNNGKYTDVLHIHVYENPSCPYNPDYCKSIGKYSGSRLLSWSMKTSTSVFGGWL